MKESVYVVLLIVTAFCSESLADEWGYSGEHDPDHWKDSSPICAHDHQSPIDIVTNHTFPDAKLSMLEFAGYDQTLSNGTFVNNGHSVQLNFPSTKTFKLSGGGMNGNTYTALQLHFHWSAPGSLKGSEHTINGMHYPVEMHIVHIKDPNKSTGQIKDMTDGLAVLGILLTAHKNAEDNPFYQKLFETARLCTYEGQKAALSNGPKLISLLPRSASFFRYQGSLTTPPCYEAVTWTVFKEPVVISRSQLKMLQSLKSSDEPESDEDGSYKSEKCSDPNCHGKDKREAKEDEADDNEEEEQNNYLGGNYRPTQPLNGRLVTSFLDIAFETTKDHDHWTYYSPSTDTSQWSKSYPTCGGNSQSPINIVSKQAKPVGAEEGSTGKPLEFEGYSQNVSGSFINNGHSVQLNIKDDLQYTLKEGGLNDSYKALQLHFHWGEVSSEGKLSDGSEHTVNGVRYPAELHIVHAKMSYLSSLPDFQSSTSDTYTVLGVFVDVYRGDGDAEPNNDDGMNPSMQSLMDAIEKIQFEGDSSEFSAGPTLASLLPADLSFYRYSGSLTTPPCSESVIWTVFPDPVTISMNQFIAFQRLFTANKDEVSERQTIARIDANSAVENTDLSRSKEPREDSADLTSDHTGEEESSNNASVVGKILSFHPGSHSDVKYASENNNVTVQYLLRNNYRPLQSINERSVYYYEAPIESATAEPTGSDSPILKIVLWTIAGIVVFIIMIALVLRCCCKKDKKKKYTAGYKADDNIVNL